MSTPGYAKSGSLAKNTAVLHEAIEYMVSSNGIREIYKSNGKSVS
jgi:hypothetical protein